MTNNTPYSDQLLDSVDIEIASLHAKRIDVIKGISSVEKSLSNATAKEYLMHGVMRRLGTITACISNIFEEFPATQEKLLSEQALKNVSINLHAFFVNIAGLMDNLAWVVAQEGSLIAEGKSTP